MYIWKVYRIDKKQVKKEDKIYNIYQYVIIAKNWNINFKSAQTWEEKKLNFLNCPVFINEFNKEKFDNILKDDYVIISWDYNIEIYVNKNWNPKLTLKNFNLKKININKVEKETYENSNNTIKNDNVNNNITTDWFEEEDVPPLL